MKFDLSALATLTVVAAAASTSPLAAPMDFRPADRDQIRGSVDAAASSASRIDVAPAVDPVTVSTTLNQLDQQKNSEALLDEVLNTLQDLVANVPSDPELRARLLGHIESLRSSALEAFVIEQELAALRREFVSARLFRALDVLSERAIAGGWTREMAQEVAAELIQRTETFVDAPDPIDFRNRVMAALERSTMTASSTSQMLAIFRQEVLMARLALLESELQAMRKNGKISPKQYEESYRRQVLRARLFYIEQTNR